MNENTPKEELKAIYKAVIKSLIVFHDCKHSYVAAVIEMREDTFSKWYRNSSRSLTIEEIKLFCQCLKIRPSLIDVLVDIILSMKANQWSLQDFLAIFSKTEEAIIVRQFLGENGYLRIIPIIVSLLLHQDNQIGALVT